MGEVEPVKALVWRRSWRVTLRRQVYFVFTSLVVAVPLILFAAVGSFADEGLRGPLRLSLDGLVVWWALLGSQALVFGLACGMWLDHYCARWGFARALASAIVPRFFLAWPVLVGADVASAGFLLGGYEGGPGAFFSFLLVPWLGLVDTLVTLLIFSSMRDAYPPVAPAPNASPQPLTQDRS